MSHIVTRADLYRREIARLKTANRVIRSQRTALMQNIRANLDQIAEIEEHLKKNREWKRGFKKTDSASSPVSSA